MDLPVLVESQVTFDTGSTKLREGELAIVTSVEEWRGSWQWTMFSLDRQCRIVQLFGPKPEQVYKYWLKPVA